MEEQPQNWYFTFGFSHAYPKGYVKINGTFSETRQKMFSKFEDKWSMQYTENKFIPQIERFDLKEIQL